jgi:uncharacterized protein
MDDRDTLRVLDAYLMSDNSSDDCRSLSGLDGFLHGIACSPLVIPPEEWVNKAIGCDADNFAGEILGHIGLRYTQILMKLSEKNPVVVPVFHLDFEGRSLAAEWSEGFLDAVALRPKEWLRLTESGSHGHFIDPLMTHILDDAGNSILGIPEGELGERFDDAAEKIPNSVVAIFQFWRLVLPPTA